MNKYAILSFILTFLTIAAHPTHAENTSPLNIKTAEINQRLIIKIPSEKQNIAFEILENKNFTLLAMDEIRRLFTPHQIDHFPDHDHLLPYLVKGKTLNDYTGNFRASITEHNLRLFHLSLGDSPVPAKPMAVLVLTDTTIDSVTVGAAMAK